MAFIANRWQCNNFLMASGLILGIRNPFHTSTTNSVHPQNRIVYDHVCGEGREIFQDWTNRFTISSTGMFNELSSQSHKSEKSCQFVITCRVHYVHCTIHYR